MEIIAYLILLWALCIISILLVFASDLRALWREPMLKHPVMILESDDWGAGPLSQAPALARLIEILGSHFDRNGRHPVMTIAIILALPNGEAVRSTGAYQRITLDDQQFAPVHHALQDGIEADVFSPQLHGMEHYWPPTLMESADPEVQAWVRQIAPRSTEELPSHLQSRWIDASKLPSIPLLMEDIETAVAEEVNLYSIIMNRPAKVVVPPTFIWSDDVEESWAKHEVEFVVTPGRRYSCRGLEGDPSCAGREIRNGDNSNGVTYLVRNDYFEPENGHNAEQALMSLQNRTKQGRPCMLETHRSNFIGFNADNSYAELNRLLSEAHRRFPELVNMDTLELGKAMRDGLNELVELHWAHRLAPWIARFDDVPRLGKLSRITGLIPVLNILSRLWSEDES